MNLGENIYQFRTKKNMSQGDLANALDVSRQSVSKWENNSAVPELDKLIRMSEIFSISIDELVGRIPSSEPGVPAQETVVHHGMPPRRIVGIILLCFGLIASLILSLLGGFIFALLFCVPLVIIGSILLACNTNLMLKTCWLMFAIYSPLCIFMLINFIGYGGSISLVATIAWFALLILETLLLLRHNQVTATTKKLAVVSVILAITFNAMLYIGNSLMYRYTALHTATEEIEEFVIPIEES